ncbi:zinc-finger domain-containing protein [Candidatus Zinderia endosymbiont of Aphrophora alni]|uniref:zinc-finger domain-containing protein n=1 Tax=Candidatus Zinderia endosymbiont of Aphrophora alni TaxID=3077951 RepID=UPI0030CB2781
MKNIIYLKNKNKKIIKCPNIKNKIILHPIIFIILNKKKETICPYCNTIYKII